jgi:hypothetical protein
VSSGAWRSSGADQKVVADGRKNCEPCVEGSGHGVKWLERIPIKK